MPSKALCIVLDTTLLANNFQQCWMLAIVLIYTPCCMLLGVVVQSLKLVKLLSPQLD